MTKKLFRIIGVLTLIVIFLLSCLIFVIMSYSALLLHTYNVFTYSQPVARVTISEQKYDDLGAYADVELIILEREKSALEYLFSPDRGEYNEIEASKYKLYGDTVYLGGPMIKFKNELIFLNFQTIFKLGKIYARYDLDNNLEINRTPAIASSSDINEGYADWVEINDNFKAPDLLGQFLRSVIDSMQISSAGQFVDDKERSYVLFITNSGFLWRLAD
jgi:hypothetical protein